MYARFVRLPFASLARGIQARYANTAAARLIQANAKRRPFLAAAGVTCLGVATAYTQGYVELAGPSKQYLNELKKQAGYKAVDDHVHSNMVVGLGTGSTLYFATERIGQKVKEGKLKNIVVIPASKITEQHAISLGIEVGSLDTHPHLDVAIDGADCVDRFLNLVKGATQGTHFREKIVANAAKKFIVIVDESKLADSIGQTCPISVEVLPFCHSYTTEVIKKLPSLAGCIATLRERADGAPFLTDNGNYVIELNFHRPINPKLANRELNETIGVVEHGLYVDLASEVIVATANGLIVEKRAKVWPARGN